MWQVLLLWWLGRNKGATMGVKDIKEMRGLELVAGSSGIDKLVRGGYCGELLSHVMANGPKGGVWLTGRDAIYGRA